MKRYYLFIGGLVLLFVVVYLLTAFGIGNATLKLGYYRMAAFVQADVPQPVTPDTEYFIVQENNQCLFSGLLLNGSYTFTIHGNAVEFSIGDKKSFTGTIDKQVVLIQFAKEDVNYKVTYEFSET